MEPAVIKGRIRTPSPNRELWVKAVSLRGIDGMDAKATPQGYFLLAGLERTDYLIVVMDGSTVVHRQVVGTVRNDVTLDIVLPAQRK